MVGALIVSGGFARKSAIKGAFPEKQDFPLFDRWELADLDEVVDGASREAAISGCCGRTLDQVFVQHVILHKTNVRPRLNGLFISSVQDEISSYLRKRFVAIELSYADVESVLAALHRISPNKRVAFRARLKHFQRLGFPVGANTGTGKRVAYSVTMLLQLAFAVELTQVGIAPKRIVEMINLNWQFCEATIPMAITPRAHFDKWQPPIATNDFVWMLSPEALRDLAEGGEHDLDYLGLLEVVLLSELQEKLRVGDVPSQIPDGWERDMGVDYRQTLIVLRPFLFSVIGLLMEVRADIGIAELWIETYNSLSSSVKSGLGRTLMLGGDDGRT